MPIAQSLALSHRAMSRRLGRSFGGKLPAAAPSLLLDTYTGAAAAYSMRKLRTAYTGAAIRVRRSSDNAEQDIGFVDNALDTATLLSFCGAGYGFVVKWYDQSGNSGDLTQVTTTYQGSVVDLNGLNALNGKAALNIRLLGRYNIPVSLTGDFFLTTVMQGTSGSPSTMDAGVIHFRSLDSSPEIILGRYGDLATVSFAGQSLFDVNSSLGAAQALSTLTLTAGNVYTFFKNGTQQAVGTASGVIGSQVEFVVGRYSLTNRQSSMSLVQELIVFNSDKSASRSGIESTINSFYGIY